jgi:Spy/CpxP family protein refolding chaperone
MKSNKIARMRIGAANASLLAATTMIIAVCVVYAFSAQQQNKAKPPAQPPINGRFENMSRELSLNADQKPKVKAIVDAQIGEWETLEKNKTLNGKQKIARMQEINQAAQSKIDKILTAEQRKKLGTIMAASNPPPAKSASKPKPKAPAPPREP